MLSTPVSEQSATGAPDMQLCSQLINDQEASVTGAAHAWCDRVVWWWWWAMRRRSDWLKLPNKLIRRITQQYLVPSTAGVITSQLLLSVTVRDTDWYKDTSSLSPSTRQCNIITLATTIIFYKITWHLPHWSKGCRSIRTVKYCWVDSESWWRFIHVI